MNGDEPVLSLEDVSVEYRENEPLINQILPGSMGQRFQQETNVVRAVEDVSLDVGEEDVVAIVGESGSGKTTLGKTSVDLQDPTRGSVKYRGHDIHEVKNGAHDGDIFYEDIRRALQIIHQDPGAALNPYRTIKTSLMQPLKRWQPEMSLADRRERILSMFRQVGLTPAEEYENRYPHELSGGEKQRVTLLRAMFSEPDVIMADEPVSALDPSLRVEIMDVMLDLQEMFGTSYIFISHNLEHARYLASKADGRIAIMYLGEIVEIGDAESIIQNPKHPYTEVLKWATLPVNPIEAQTAVREEIPLRTMEVPDAANKPSGCHFHSRCPYAREACTEQDPPLIPADAVAEQRAACFREDDEHEYWDSTPLPETEEEGEPIGEDETVEEGKPTQ